MNISVTFDPPLPTDPASTYQAKALDTFGKLGVFAQQANALASDVNTKAEGVTADLAGAEAAKALAQQSVQSAALIVSNLGDLLPLRLAAETGYAWGVLDRLGHAALLIGLDGTVTIPLSNIPQVNGRLVALETLPYQTTQLQADVQELQGLVAQAMPVETGYAWGVVDRLGRAALLIGLDGAITAPLLQLPVGAVTSSSLSSNLAPMIARVMSPETGYAWAVVDSAGRIGLGIKLDGTVVGNVIQSLPDESVTAVKLTAQLQRQVIPHVSDVVSVAPDDWRGKDASVAVRTAASGSLWRAFPSLHTQNLRGINTSGTSLQFRRASGLLIRGERDCGSWSPGSVASVNSKGTVNASTTWPPSGTFVAGDYYIYSDATSRVIGSTTVQRSDVLVYDGSAWQVQAAPVPYSGSGISRSPRDWWMASSSGTFDGVSYAAGDRIVCLGFDSMAVYGVHRWYKGRSGMGELFYKGTFDPSAGLPTAYADGQVWQASAVGSAGGFAFAIGDYLIRESNAWGQVPTEPITTVPSGGYGSLRCTDAAEWEVRRTDVSATTAGVQLTARRMTTPRQPVEGVRLLSDSMYGVSSVGALILSKLGRTGVVNSYGGGTSTDVRNMLEREIATGGDRYRGWLHGIWCGQNNQPTVDAAGTSATVREDVLRMASLIGSRDAKFYFKSVLGRRVLTWNGTRMVCAQHEDMFAGIGALYALEQWYAVMFPGQWFSPRLALLAAAASSTLPDPTFPGMTESQVAATYGIVPFSYFLDASGLPVSQSALLYKGTWAAPGLPSGGAANDYYLRTSNGPVGNLLINNSGTWVEPLSDLTHLSPAGADALATFESNFIFTNSF